LSQELPPEGDLANWVKDALTHYWGGPKLTNSPLMRLQIVQEAVSQYDGNAANALRALLRKAVDQVKPDGERRFTTEWILYNILEMKFIEGRKVRDVAGRLAMSEADLYRKQRVAVEAVAKAILEMELQTR
jgi:chemotaxis protein CheY-P-specific phosphatase CheC